MGEGDSLPLPPAPFFIEAFDGICLLPLPSFKLESFFSTVVEAESSTFSVVAVSAASFEASSSAFSFSICSSCGLIEIINLPFFL